MTYDPDYEHCCDRMEKNVSRPRGVNGGPDDTRGFRLSASSFDRWPIYHDSDDNFALCFGDALISINVCPFCGEDLDTSRSAGDDEENVLERDREDWGLDDRSTLNQDFAPDDLLWLGEKHNMPPFEALIRHHADRILLCEPKSLAPVIEFCGVHGASNPAVSLDKLLRVCELPAIIVLAMFDVSAGELPELRNAWFDRDDDGTAIAIFENYMTDGVVEFLSSSVRKINRLLNEWDGIEADDEDEDAANRYRQEEQDKREPYRKLPGYRSEADEDGFRRFKVRVPEPFQAAILTYLDELES